MQRKFCVIISCIMIISMLAGCSVFKKVGLNGNDEVSPVSSIALSEADAQQIADKTPISLYFANEEGTKLKLEKRYIPMSELKKPTNELATLIVKELINGPAKGSGLKATIPAETKLHSNVKVEDGVATVDFSKEFKEKHPGGKKEEQLTIYSIVNSLTELSDISQVKFKIDGKTSKEFKGNFKFDNPFPRSAALISKEVTPSGSLDNSNSKGKDEENKKDQTENSNKDSKDDTKKDSKDNIKSNSKDTVSDQSSEVYDEDAAAEVKDGENSNKPNKTSDNAEEDKETLFYLEDELLEDEILE
jgi:germination protein M